jgi:acetylornithine deacetylase/succinyl-diaminopimelate desuccinylase-like protein
MLIIRDRPDPHRAPPALDLIATLASVTEPALRATVEALSYPRHRLHQAGENRRAARWLARAFADLGYAVTSQGELENVVARAPDGQSFIGQSHFILPLT